MISCNSVVKKEEKGGGGGGGGGGVYIFFVTTFQSPMTIFSNYLRLFCELK